MMNQKHEDDIFDGVRLLHLTRLIGSVYSIPELRQSLVWRTFRQLQHGQEFCCFAFHHPLPGGGRPMHFAYAAVNTTLQNFGSFFSFKESLPIFFSSTGRCAGDASLFAAFLTRSPFADAPL